MHMRSMPLNPCGVFAALGLGLNLVWCTLMGHTMGFMSSATGIESWVNPRIFFLLGIFALAVSYVIAPRKLKRSDRVLRYVLPLISAAGTACFGLSYHQTFFAPQVLAVGGLFVAGVGYFWLVARYNLMLARTQGYSCAVWSVAGGLIVKLPILFALSVLMGPEWQVVVAIALPVISALVFEVACSLARGASEGDDGGDFSASVRTVYGVPAKPKIAAPTSQTFRRNTFIMVAVSAILLAVIRSVSYLGMWGNTNANISDSVPWLMGLVVPALSVAAFAYFALIRMSDFTLAIRFQPAMLLTLAGLFVVVVQASSDSASMSLLIDVIQIDELFAHLLFWTVVITALDALDLPSYRVIGIAGAIYAGASIAWVLLLGESAVISNVFVLLATYVIVIVAMSATWFGGKRRTDEAIVQGRAASGGLRRAAEARTGNEADTWEAHAPRVDAKPSTPLTKSVHDTCLALAARYGLSPREAEVFVLLAQGRTRAFIQDELVLSNGTVKTHVSHIYAKMDVHDRQEMMDLVWQSDDDSADESGDAAASSPTMGLA
ncbi:response regulator transcription factor [Raoultibacter phocaeensis]|uniref:response regulator transcription factor n=1 Tax=Raoultibacter phocaeensis TaxID=2479841 RepID=UPI00111A4003|nr:helix-turn-helix transcriptional regulator [Raoultibacter phocaeensis]